MVVTPRNAGFSELLRVAVASVDFGGPRPKVLTLDFLRAMLATAVLPAADQLLAQRLIQRKQPQAERQRLRTSQPLMAVTLYCSALCNEMAATIRYGRGVHADGRLGEPDVEEALRIRMASVTGGGYPRGERKLTSEQRQAIVERDGGLCQHCGKPGNEIDHIGVPSEGHVNHPSNLQLLCAECHRKKTISSHRIATDPEHIARALEMRDRMDAPVAVRPCDEPGPWADRQRQLRAERRAEFCEHLERRTSAALGAA